MDGVSLGDQKPCLTATQERVKAIAIGCSTTAESCRQAVKLSSRAVWPGTRTSFTEYAGLDLLIAGPMRERLVYNNMTLDWSVGRAAAAAAALLGNASMSSQCS